LGKGDQIAGPVIPGTTDYGYDFLTGIHLAKGETIRIGMGGHFNQSGHNNGIEAGTDILHGIDFEAGHGQTVAKLLRGQVKINKFPQPVAGDDHFQGPL
jgi:hypothetical protein